MRRIAILTAGGDTPALNATIYGAVERANQLDVEVYGIFRGFAGILNSRVPHIHLNPLFITIPEIDPCFGGTAIGASRTYISSEDPKQLKLVAHRLQRLGIEGLICIGGDGTISGMQPLSDFFPCVLAPKTIDNDLGLNYIDEPNEWNRELDSEKEVVYTRGAPRDRIDLHEIVNYATPGYATAVFVVVQSIERIRTTAESHRRIAIVEVMGRDSGYIALGSAYGQPDIILIPEVPLDFARFTQRVQELYDLQKHVVIVVGEGVVDQNGHPLGASHPSYDPAGNILFEGAADALKKMLSDELGDGYFQSHRRHESAEQAIFTRKVGHTQRGGRPIRFDRFYATQLGGKAVDLLMEEQNNYLSILMYSQKNGFALDSLHANKLRDQWGKIHARIVHPTLFDAHRFQPSPLGIEYLSPVFNNAIGSDDLEMLRADLFSLGNLTSRYQSVNIDMQKRMRYLHEHDEDFM